MNMTLQDAADAFYEAGNKMFSGDLTAFEAIWSDSDDISHLGPTGNISIGRAAVMDEFAKEAGMRFEGTLRADDRRYIETADMGYMVCVEKTRGMTEAGQAITIDIRATTIFRKESGQWRVVYHHTDRF